MSTKQIHICWTIDCEASQKSISDIGLGIRSVRGFVDAIHAAGMKATLYVLPSDASAYPQLLRSIADEGAEIGLHYHPQEAGFDDYCGAYTSEEQYAMYEEAVCQFSNCLGFSPRTFRTGSCSANDATFKVTEELGFTSCSHSMPGRNMVNLRSSWVNSPMHVHRTHPANRLLEGDSDLIEVPITTDPESMMWSGGHPQDLRVELFDAKNQRYLIEKVLVREKARCVHTKAMVTLTHNIFEYSDQSDFRTQTMKQMLTDLVHLADQNSVELIPSTVSEVASAFRNSAVEEKSVATVDMTY